MDINNDNETSTMLSKFPIELHVTCDNRYILSGIIAYEGSNNVAFFRFSLFLKLFEINGNSFQVEGKLMSHESVKI